MKFLNRVIEAGHRLDQSVYRRLGISKVVEAIKPKLPPAIMGFGARYGLAVPVFILVALCAAALFGPTAVTTPGDRPNGEALERFTGIPGEESDGTGEPSGAGVGSTDITSSGAGAPRTTSGAQGGTAAQNLRLGRGVNDTTIRVGFEIPENLSAGNALFGVESEDLGDQRAMIRALVKYVNDGGGIHGRKIEAFFRSFDLANGDWQTQQVQTCTAFAEDDKVFAVVRNAGGGESVYACYAKHELLLISVTSIAWDDDFFADTSPYYWAPNNPNMSRTVRSMVAGLEAQKYFTQDSKVGVVHWDEPNMRRVVEKDLKPALAKIGRSLDDTAAAPFTNAESAAQAAALMQNAVVRFNSRGINRVLLLDPLTAILFMNSAEGQTYRPKYGVSSFSTAGPASAPEEQARGTLGIGWVPGGEIPDSDMPFPSTEAEKLCMQIMKSAGQEFATRSGAVFALQMCDGIFFLQQTGNKTGIGLNVRTWSDQAWRLGTGFNSSYTLQSRFVAKRQDGADLYRPMAFDTGCVCFHYTDSGRPFE